MVAIRQAISKRIPGWLRASGRRQVEGGLCAKSATLPGPGPERAPSRLWRGHSRRRQRPSNVFSAGFTLVELMVVMLIISVLLAVAVPSFISAIRTAREAALRQDLHTMRDAIEQYTEDKQAAPQSLDDLVQAGYLRKMPVDPMTHQNNTWVADQSDTYSNIDQSQPGIDNVHSGSNQMGSDGVPYSQW